MNMSALKNVHPLVLKTVLKTASPNAFGETPLPCAPTVNTASGEQVVPQQYLDVNRTLASVEAILSLITTPKDHLLFAGQENGLVYLMCGVIGRENYSANLADSKNANQPKIVYGRRWLLEPSTPTSEVVQTALLAIKKVREHELREHFRLRINVPGTNKAGLATPFNCHMDLPLMAAEMKCLDDSGSTRKNLPEAMNDSLNESPDMNAMLSRISIDGLRPSLSFSRIVTDVTLYGIQLNETDKTPHSFTELKGRILPVLCQTDTQSEFLHELFNSALKVSDRLVEETVKFDGFARFSHAICPSKIAEFSYKTRNTISKDAAFENAFTDMSYRVDASKAPVFNAGELGQKQRDTLRQHTDIGGYLPHV